jgi:FdhD protein
MSFSSSIPIIKVVEGKAFEQEDKVASEKAVSLLVNGTYLVSLLCSPADLEAMATGFLLSEGLLTDRKHLSEITVNEAESTIEIRLSGLPDNWQEVFHSKTLTSGCGKGITFSSPASLRTISPVRSSLQVAPQAILELMQQFRTASLQFQQTGGVHSAALADKERILLFAEDIGRHNAVDKIIGKAFLALLEVSDKILLSSGRISGEIMTKIIRGRVPILVSRAAPTCMAVTQAEDFGITLVGFARNRRMNIYTHPQRILF